MKRKKVPLRRPPPSAILGGNPPPATPAMASPPPATPATTSPPPATPAMASPPSTTPAMASLPAPSPSHVVGDPSPQLPTTATTTSDQFQMEEHPAGDNTASKKNLRKDKKEVEFGAILRRKYLVRFGAPNYGNCRGVYTIKMHHGGELDEKNDGTLEYKGGTVSAFDFVDTGRTNMKYLDGLASQLGYLGEKVYYSKDRSGKLEVVDGVFDIDRMFNNHVNRVCTLYLVALRDDKCSEHEEIEGEVEWYDEENVGSMEKNTGNHVEENVFNEVEDVAYTNLEEDSMIDVAVETEIDETDFWDERRKGKQIQISIESDDESDDEFECDMSSGDEILDDIMYEENVDKELEWAEVVRESNEKESADDFSSCDDQLSNESDFQSVASEEEDEYDRDRHLTFRPSQVENPEFFMEQIFPTKQLFKEAVNMHSVKTGRSLKFTKNDGRRIYARCKQEGCDWHINALKVTNQMCFQIREFNPDHTCARQYHIDNVKSGWLAKRYETEFRADPKKSVKGFRSTTSLKLGCHISHDQAYRARQKALKLIEGSSTEQYTKLWDYCQTLIERNPGSTVILKLENGPTGNRFSKLYICFAALKQGFKSGLRPWIGVDGCHLKGLCAGVLLTAVGMDPNNDPYPLAYAVVGSETKDAWEWFLQLLKADLMLEREDVYTFMSDKQKGLIPAFDNIIPGVENRFCVRHLHGNMKRAGFKGDAFKKALWAAAKATTVPSFNTAMAKIGELDPRCLAWLQEKPASQWSRSHFNTFAKCDTLVNNMCEIFNSAILDARSSPILTMLEWIREYIMSRLQKNRDKCERIWEGRTVCGRIRMILWKNIEASKDCMPLKSNDWKYEISCFDGSRYAVDLKACTCDCRQWELSGIPCKHAVSAICSQGWEVEDFVHKCYSVETYAAVYAHCITPMSGQELWSKTSYIPPLPPHFGKKKKGRPV